LCNTWQSLRLWPLCFSDALRIRMRGNLRATPGSGRRSWRGSRKVRAKMGASVGLATRDQVVNENQQREVKAAWEEALVIDVAVTHVDREATDQPFP
jgi:hypothetical protein